ncbi:uncharacterized protein L201_007528 [Kwoniella dendrophila CBS 6074]|uniref:BAH domain-containing protein n=1 Tax=Kwoniella dendrophila CBS 6074 TaxID=1295534 RepID=A0AAX4K623_9TREE
MTSKRITDDAPTDDATWTAPTEQEFRALRRYKSFLLPPNNSYAVGQFVWLAHGQPISNYAQRNNKKPRHSTLDNGVLPTGELVLPGPLERIHEEEDSDIHWDGGFWIGRIAEIRARDTSFVWMRIRWMCRTIAELKEQGIGTGLPRSKGGIKEVYTLGPEFDCLQPVGAVESDAPVIMFDERNPMQAPFGRHRIFTRFEARTPTAEEAAELVPKRVAGNVEPKSKKKARQSDGKPQGHLFPMRNPTCYCKDPYRPLTDREEPMALCAHKDCLKWFHFGCLDWRNDHRRTPTPSMIEDIVTSGLELMDLLPEYGLTTPARSLPFEKDPSELDFAKLGEPGESVRKVTPSENNTNTNGAEKDKPKTEEIKHSSKDFSQFDGSVPSIDSRILEKYQECDSHIDKLVIKVAQSAIVRGTIDTGIVGNTRYIIRARQIIHENRKIRSMTKGDPDQVEVKKIGKMIEEWKEIWEINDPKLEENEDEKPKKEEKDPNGNVPEEIDPSKRAVIWLCPSCRRAI